MSWNVRSITNKFKEIKQVILEADPDVVLLQETWAIPDKFDITIPGYHQPYISTRKTKRGGGVCTYVKTNIAVKVLKSPFVEGHLETKLLKLTLKNITYHCLNAYFGQNNKEKIIYDFTSFIASEKSNNNQWIIGGDFNIDLLKTDKSEPNYLIDSMASLELFPQANFPTRILQFGNTVQTGLIDNIFCPLGSKTISCKGILTRDRKSVV